MRLATWNVNSIRSRVDRVVSWLDRSDIDVLAIQETKCRDDQFPSEPFEERGYEIAHVGFNQWNGVAIVSRVGLADVEIAFPGQPGFDRNAAPSDRSARSGLSAGSTPASSGHSAGSTPASATLFDAPVIDARAIAATCGGVRVWSLYVPNGRAQDDPHFQYKLDWLAALRDNGARWLAANPDAPIALVGDWNIAPTDDDVWSVDYYVDKTHISKPERNAFEAVVDAGFTDVVRPFTPGPGVYTYWDYTQLRFPRKEGMRIDFVLASPALATRVTDAVIDREERKGKGQATTPP